MPPPDGEDGASREDFCPVSLEGGAEGIYFFEAFFFFDFLAFWEFWMMLMMRRRKRRKARYRHKAALQSRGIGDLLRFGLALVSVQLLGLLLTAPASQSLLGARFPPVALHRRLWILRRAACAHAASA